MLGLRALLATATFSVVAVLPAQTDSLFMKSGDIVVGELKSMVRSVATVETKYSDSDFKVDWDEVRMVRSSSQYLVQLSEGEQYTAHLYSMDSVTVLLIGATDTTHTSLTRIVYLKSVKADFWSRAAASVDVGYNYTKASNLQQFSLRAFLGYQTDRWMANTTFNKVNSTQDAVADIQRTDMGATFRWSLPKGYFAAIDASFLSNTEQLLDLRSSIQPYVGNYLARNNSMYLLVALGSASTREDYSTDDPVRTSIEGLMALELNLFDVGDIDLLLSSKAFPSFTEEGRWRMDHRFDVKYDLPLDLYVRAGLTLNYDNRPVTGAVETDYVVQTALGWEL